MTTKALVTTALEIAELTQQIVDAGGELTPVIEECLEISGAELMQKADRYAAFLDRLDSERATWKDRADAYGRVAKSLASLKDRLNSNIKLAMQIMGTHKIDGEESRLLLSRGAPKLVIDDTKLPDAWKMAVTEYVPDKERIKAAIERGETIEGVTQEDVFSLRKSVARKIK